MAARIFAIDPGPEVSAFVCWDGQRIVDHDIVGNVLMLERLRTLSLDNGPVRVAIEMIASYGMAVGAEVFETCVWIGRFIQASPVFCERYFRSSIKLHLCGTARAKDANVRQALIDLIGPQGRKAAPGPTYGIRSHCWAALAVAVYAASCVEIPF
jgi:hypothetical protein